MNYRIKEEYIDQWGGMGNHSEIITEQELKDMCRGWEMDKAALMEQLEPVNGNIAEIASPTRWGFREPVKTKSAMAVARQLGSGQVGEWVNVYDHKGRLISRVICGPRGYYRVNV